MPKIHYLRVIEEDPKELKKLEKYHRYTHLFQRVRMLRLLRSEECCNLGEAARALGYSWRQCQRWFQSYQKGGIEELLKSRVSQRGRQELVTPEAFEDLEEAMKRGEIATISQADEFLRERHTASSTPIPMVSANSSGGARRSSRRAALAMRRPTRRSRRSSKKLRRHRPPNP